MPDGPDRTGSALFALGFRGQVFPAEELWDSLLTVPAP
jgi:hypothetical protein